MEQRKSLGKESKLGGGKKNESPKLSFSPNAHFLSVAL